MKYKSMLITNISMLIIAILISACSTNQLNRTKSINNSIEDNSTIAVYGFKNFTDTPMAGQRGASIAVGVLNSKGYRVIDSIKDEESKLSNLQKLAIRQKAKYLLDGSINEWRYKTGIDGEPAISLTMRLIRAKDGKVVWSATGSRSDWGTASVGTTAQELIQDMFR